MTIEDTFVIETGYGDRNEWLEWIKYMARTTKAQVFISVQLHDKIWPQCQQWEIVKHTFVKLFSQENVTGCEADKIRYPALKLSIPPNVVAYKNNYTCYERSEGSIDRKTLGPGWCRRTIKENETEVGILVNHNLTRAVMW